MDSLQSRASAGDSKRSLTVMTVSDGDGADQGTCTPRVDPDAVQRKLNRHLVPWLFTLGTLCYLDRTNLSFAALELNRDLALSCTTYGLGASLFFVSYAIFQVPSTLVCARLGAPVWLSANIVAWGIVATCFALARSVPVFLALRVLLGATECAAFPGIYHHLSLFYSERDLGPAYSAVASCTALSQVVGAPLAAALLMLDGAAGLHGWQWMFLVEGGLTVAFGLVLRFRLAPSPAKARMLSHAEREWLQQEQDAARTAAAARRQGRPKGLLGVVRDWRVLYLAGTWLLIATVMVALMFFLPLLVSAMFSGNIAVGGAAPHHSACAGGDGSSGESKQQQQRHTALVALATSIPFIAAALGMNINARLARRANERHRHAGVPLLLAGAALAAIPLALHAALPSLAFVLLTLAAGLCWSLHGPFFSWPACLLPGDEATAAFAVINSCGSAGGFLGPFLLGLLTDRSDGGLAPSFLALAACLFAAGTLILCFPAPGSLGPHGGYADPAHGSPAVLGEDEDEEGSGSGSCAALDAEAGAVGERPRRLLSSHERQGSSKQLGGEVECQPILPAGGGRSA